MADVKIRLDQSALRRLDRAAVTALEQTAEAIHTDLVQSRTMPFRSGNLQNESTFVDTSESARGHVELVSATPYARRLYYHPEYHFSAEENPDAGAGWFEPYTAEGEKRDFAEKAFRRLYRKGAGV